VTPTPAVVVIASPANNATVSGTVNIVVAVQDPPVAWVNFVIDGNYIASSPPLTYAWNTTTLANGTHTIEVNAKDSNGNLLASPTITVTLSNGDPLPTPTATPSATLTATLWATATTAIVAIKSPANGGTVSGTVTINVAAEEPPVSWGESPNRRRPTKSRRRCRSPSAGTRPPLPTAAIQSLRKARTAAAPSSAPRRLR
jgi:Bacterial Ig domain